MMNVNWPTHFVEFCTDTADAMLFLLTPGSKVDVKKALSQLTELPRPYALNPKPEGSLWEKGA